MTIKTIFLDRDGVINKEVNYLYKIKNFEFCEGIFKVCQHLISLNYQIIIITNQSGIARGFYSEFDYQNLTSWMLEQFKNRNINILDVFHCPHGPNSDCRCRKPKPGLLYDAQIKYGIDMKNSWMIGDQERDIEAAIDAGIANTILINNLTTIDSKSKANYTIKSLKKIPQLIPN